MQIDRPNLTDIPADDTQTLTFTGKITSNLPEIYRTLVFECSDGKFIGVGEDKKREIIVNEKGEAKVIWKVGSVAGKKYVNVSIKGVANAKLEKELVLIAPSPSFKMILKDKGSILADDKSLLNILIDSVRNIPSNKIQILKNAGEFLDAAGSPIKNGEINIVNGKASVFVKMGQNVETYFVKGQTTDGTFFINETFTPLRANGEEIFADAILQNTDIKITAYLKRSFGKVSVGTPVTFRAYQLIDNKEKEVGVFQNLVNAVTNSEEKTGEIVLKQSDDIIKTSPIYIVASAKNQNGEKISTKPISFTYPVSK
ncbi:MAG: hypothetical protein IPH28_14000 [Cytophagaceae bacterium]|nr:hypothetical protein [Cytophagaceae bacterium]